MLLNERFLNPSDSDFKQQFLTYLNPNKFNMALYAEFDDVKLLSLMKNGDTAAFTEIYNRYWAVLFKHGRKLLGDEEEAVDVVQDVFTDLWLKYNTIDITISVKSYLYRSVRNRILNKIKHNKIMGRYLDWLENMMEKEEYVTDNQIRMKELTKQIEKEIAGLPIKMQRIFQLSRKEGYSHQQIADELNIPGQTVKNQIHKAIKILRTKLNNMLAVLYGFY